MALGSALVDRAKFVRRAPTGKRVEGTKLFHDTPGPWFRCRLQMPQQQESGEGGRRRGVTVPTLTVGRRDQDGGIIEFKGDDRIVVRSNQLATDTTLQVNGDPEPIRKRRTIIGWTVTLTRVDS